MRNIHSLLIYKAIIHTMFQNLLFSFSRLDFKLYFVLFSLVNWIVYTSRNIVYLSDRLYLIWVLDSSSFRPSFSSHHELYRTRLNFQHSYDIYICLLFYFIFSNLSRDFCLIWVLAYHQRIQFLFNLFVFVTRVGLYLIFLTPGFMLSVVVLLMSLFL